ncbi:hypothetical protein BG006_001785 [Podila minutissima]|uniref:Uncharacterized protein n=1 Tax=Podila minutissima TaxID=64525 RepID=A0A9P5SNK7_9FUNG|nr:hypothetical protein BG006_001785 [Podila minutissima]
MAEWITSEHKPRPRRITQARLTPALEIGEQSGSSGPRPPARSNSKTSSDDNQGNQDTGRSSTTSTHRQTRLEMGQRSPPKQPSPTRKPLPDALTAIQDKLAKDQPKIGGYLSRMGVKPVVAANTGHTSTDKKASTSSTKPTTPKATSSSAARNSTGNKGSAKSKKEPALVSIADKIPRGSRAKPIPPKQAQSPLQSAGSKSPSPSTPHSAKEDTSQSTEDDLVIIQPSPSQHSKPSAPLVARPRQTREQPQTIVLSSSPPDSRNDSDLECDIAEIQEPSEADKMMREPSILTIESSKTFSIASDIPSIEVDAIERWVGGVQQALGSDDDETTAIRASNLIPGTTKAINTRQQSSILARPATHGVIKINSSPPHVIPSTFDEQEVKPVSGKDGECSHPQTPQKGRQARVLVPDSLSWTSSAPHNLWTGSSVSPVKGPQAQDDISTIVGGQTTQDTFGLRSLPSFVSDRENLEQEMDEQENDQRPAALPSGLTSSCLQELGLLKRRTSDSNSPRKRRTSAGWNSELGSDPLHEDPEEDVMMAQRGYFSSSFGAAPSTQSPLSYNYGLASIDEDSPKYQPMARLRHAMGQQAEGREDVEGGDVHDGSRDSSYPSVESMRGQESYEDFHRRILANTRVHVLDDSQPSLPSMPSMTGLSTLQSFPSIPSLPTLPSFSSMPSSAAFHEQEPIQEP